jgi:putative oxidoreductase
MEVLYAHLVESLRRKLEALEARVVPWLACYSVTILRVGLGSIFLGFGLLKFFPGFSPAEGLVMHTLGVLSFGLVPVRVGVVLVAALECAIGLGLITGRFLRPSLALLGFQMIGAMSPLVLFPGELFSGPFYAPTLEGQYVLKDVVLISAGLVIGTTLQGGRLISGHTHRSVAHRGHARNTPLKTTPREYTDSARFKA